MARILVLSLFAITLFVAVNGYKPIVQKEGILVTGGSPIDDTMTDEEVQVLGMYILEQMNAEDHNHGGDDDDRLVFSRVLEAKKQMYLKIEAMDHGEKKTFDTVIWNNPSTQEKEILNFSESTQI